MSDNHQDVIDLYNFLGISDAEEVKTTFPRYQLDGYCTFDDYLDDTPCYAETSNSSRVNRK